MNVLVSTERAHYIPITDRQLMMEISLFFGVCSCSASKALFNLCRVTQLFEIVIVTHLLDPSVQTNRFYRGAQNRDQRLRCTRRRRIGD